MEPTKEDTLENLTPERLKELVDAEQKIILITSKINIILSENESDPDSDKWEDGQVFYDIGAFVAEELGFESPN